MLCIRVAAKVDSNGPSARPKIPEAVENIHMPDNRNKKFTWGSKLLQSVGEIVPDTSTTTLAFLRPDVSLHEPL